MWFVSPLPIDVCVCVCVCACVCVCVHMYVGCCHYGLSMHTSGSDL